MNLLVISLFAAVMIFSSFMAAGDQIWMNTHRGYWYLEYQVWGRGGAEKWGGTVPCPLVLAPSAFGHLGSLPYQEWTQHRFGGRCYQLSSYYLIVF